MNPLCPDCDGGWGDGRCDRDGGWSFPEVKVQLILSCTQERSGGGDWSTGVGRGGRGSETVGPEESLRSHHGVSSLDNGTTKKSP